MQALQYRIWCTRGASLVFCRSTQRAPPSRRRAICSSAAELPWLSESSDTIRNDFDAIIVLAGGQRTDGRLPPWVERRLDVSLSLQHHQVGRPPVVCCGGGTPHKPPILRPAGFVLHEGTECAQYLIAQGAESGRLLKEASSYDTIGNGYFAMTIHAIPAGWRRLAVVTSDFHMPRSKSIFQVTAALAGMALWQDPDRFELSFFSATDDGIFPDEVLEARLEREAASLAGWQRTVAGFKGFGDLHTWIHQEHMCYAVRRQEEFGRHEDGVDAKALATY